MDELQKTLSQYAGSAVHIVSDIELTQQKSKAGNIYSALVIHFTNGYSERIFINSQNSFAILDALKQSTPRREPTPEETAQAHKEFQEDTPRKSMWG